MSQSNCPTRFIMIQWTYSWMCFKVDALIITFEISTQFLFALLMRPGVRRDQFFSGSKENVTEMHSSFKFFFSKVEFFDLDYRRLSDRNGACAHYLMVSWTQRKPFWLATQLCSQNDWTGWQNGVSRTSPMECFFFLFFYFFLFFFIF